MIPTFGIVAAVSLNYPSYQWGTSVESTTNNLEELNETGNRTGDERREGVEQVSGERRKVQRRRLIDPTTCERDYTNDEIEFMQAMDEYKRKSGRMFPTCSEILEVLRGMGYVRVELTTETEEAIDLESGVATPLGVRSADVIAGDFEQLEDLEESFDEEFEEDFDDE